VINLDRLAQGRSKSELVPVLCGTAGPAGWTLGLEIIFSSLLILVLISYLRREVGGACGPPPDGHR